MLGIGRILRALLGTTTIQRQLADVDAQLAALRLQVQNTPVPGPAVPEFNQAVYMGNGRVLARLAVPEIHSPSIIYLLDGADRMLVPRMAIEGIYEPDSTRFVLRNIRENFNCVDVGANFGYFTCILARLAWRGRTLALEADPEMAALLRENILINWSEKSATALNRAAADHAGTLRLWRRRGAAANTSIATPSAEMLSLRGEAPPEPFDVAATPIDDLLDDLGGRIDFIKIDVEGAEPLVFRGARRAIAQNPGLIILMEWSPDQIRDAGFNTTDFIADLRAQALHPHILLPGGDTAPISWDDLGTAEYGNIVLRRKP